MYQLLYLLGILVVTGYAIPHADPKPHPQSHPEILTKPPKGLNYQQRNLNTIQSIYNLTVYPKSLAFLQNGSASVPPGLFNANATGRISPVGNFSGFTDSVEYFFGLTPPVQAPVYDTWTSAKVVEFTSGCPEVASSVVYGATTVVNASSPDYGKYITSIKQVNLAAFLHPCRYPY